MNKKYALLSVYHKEGIVEFARELVELGWSLIASGGTRKELVKNELDAMDVADLVGGEAILGHRVVTLSREIHAGLLARDCEEDHVELKRCGIPWIDLVCVDLYPLKEAVNNPEATRESVIEKTDIGGPAMLRSAAKGRRIVICDPADRTEVLSWLRDGCPDEDEFRNALAAKVEAVCADYSLTSARFHSRGGVHGFIGRKVQECKYGENPAQAPAGLYEVGSRDPLACSRFEFVKGGAPSHNNWCDDERALQTITHIAAGFEHNRGYVPYIAVAVKHGNACGAAVAKSPSDAVWRMVDGSPRDIMGACVITNFAVNAELAGIMREHKYGYGQRGIDVVLAPDFTDDGISALKRPNGTCRRLKNPALSELGRDSLDTAERFRYVRGGFLTQPNYTYVLDLADEELRLFGRVDDGHTDGLILSWAVGCTSNSNSFTLVHRDGYLIGNGVGQQSRVEAVRLAVDKARASEHDCRGSIAYTDSFFPFTDGPEDASKAGVECLLLPTGSMNDNEVLAFCGQHFTVYALPHQKLRGFYGH